nr:Protein involved in mRNA turnover and stability [Ipomoea batatas]
MQFAHRKCIQRWCNKKGDITCEICSQVFSPNYTLPPARSNPDVLAIDISQAWGPAIDLRDPRFLAFATAEHQLLQSEYDDYAIASSSSLACFRYVAIIADDATPVSTPNVDGCKGLSNASGIIIVLQCKCKMMVSGTNKLALSESRSG